jgi:hypothetical protein
MISKFKPNFPFPKVTPGDFTLKGSGDLHDITVLQKAFRFEVPDTDGSYPVGRYFYNGFGVPTGTAVSTANVLQFYPFIVEQTVFVDKIAFGTTATGTNGNGVVGIYNTNNNLPSQLIITSGAKAIDNTLATTTLASRVLLVPGTYWVARNTSSDKTFTAFAVGFTHRQLGANVTDLTTFAAGPSATGYQVAFTYTGTLPTTAPSLAAATFITTSVPAVALNVVSLPTPAILKT